MYKYGFLIEGRKKAKEAISVLADPATPFPFRSTVINTSKEMMAFSDFPIPKEYPPYMHNSQIIEYFDSYVKHFGLDKHIHFLTKVLKVVKSPDYDATGRWTVT